MEKNNYFTTTMVKVSKKELENIYDNILRYLDENRYGRSIEGILQNTDYFYKYKNDIIKNLINKGYVRESNDTKDYYLTDSGKEFILHSSFGALRKQRQLNLIFKYATTIGGILAGIGGIVAAIYYIGEILKKH